MRVSRSRHTTENAENFLRNIIKYVFVFLDEREASTSHGGDKRRHVFSRQCKTLLHLRLFYLHLRFSGGNG